MNSRNRWFVVFPGAALAGALIAALPGVSRAQNAPAAAAPPPPPSAAQASNGARLRTLDVIAAAIGRAAGVQILADSTVATANVPLPAQATTPQNFESQLDAIVKALPVGSTWAKVYLPMTSSTRRLDPDAVTEYVTAQAHLFGTVGAATPNGMVEIMGQRLGADKANPVITNLSLKPVYLITNPNAPRADGNDPMSQNWNQMTQDQKQQYAQKQAQQLLNMDAQGRAAYMQQQMATVQAMMQQMTPDQRQQFFQTMGGMMGGMGGGGGGRRNRGGGGGGNFGDN